MSDLLAQAIWRAKLARPLPSVVVEPPKQTNNVISLQRREQKTTSKSPSAESKEISSLRFENVLLLQKIEQLQSHVKMLGGETWSFNRPTVRLIVKMVADYFCLDAIDLISQRRTHRVLRPRQIAMYLARTATTYSLPHIGRMIGNRDHTTVLHGVRTIERLRGIDAKMNDDVRQIEDRLASLKSAGAERDRKMEAAE